MAARRRAVGRSFEGHRSFDVLERYRKKIASFNDDIQGTGAVALAGLVSACALRNRKLRDEVVVVHGAGAGGVGVAWAIQQGMMRDGLSATEALARVFVLDSKGLLVEGRAMEDYKKPVCPAARAGRGVGRVATGPRDHHQQVACNGAPRSVGTTGLLHRLDGACAHQSH